jgi:hypothetical protein
MTDTPEAIAEREAIVEWLECWIDQTMGQDVDPQYVIDAIERGDHIKQKEPTP